MGIIRKTVGRAARRLGLFIPMPSAQITYDRTKAEETRRRDELAEYDEHLSVYGRHFAPARALMRGRSPF
jgi:hypothetical protein